MKGHFPLPGQPATTRPAAIPTSPVIPGMDPSRAAMMMGMTHELPPRPKVSQGAAGPVAQTASLARQARRLYVGNIPYGIDEVKIIIIILYGVVTQKSFDYLIIF